MDEVEKALTEAIRAAIETRRAIYTAANTVENEADQGQLRFAAESLDSHLALMRRMRRALRRNAARKNS